MPRPTKTKSVDKFIADLQAQYEADQRQEAFARETRRQARATALAGSQKPAARIDPREEAIARSIRKQAEAERMSGRLQRMADNYASNLAENDRLRTVHTVMTEDQMRSGRPARLPVIPIPDRGSVRSDPRRHPSDVVIEGKVLSKTETSASLRARLRDLIRRKGRPALRVAFRLAQGVGRAANLLDHLISLLEMFPDLLPGQKPVRAEMNMGNWVLYRQCHAYAGRALSWKADANPDQCLGGQSLASNQPYPWGNQAEPLETFSALYQRTASTLVVRGDEMEIWRRPAGVAGGTSPAIGIQFANGTPTRVMPAADPNVMRYAPPSPQPLTQPVYTTAPVSTPAPAPYAGVGGGPSGPPARTGVTGRFRPGRSTKERKTKAKKALGAVLFGLLDTVSEWSEIVDAFYKAMPEDVQKRAGCNRKAAFIDNAGQYGIDNADCKLRSLLNNWETVDVEQAIRNVIANEIEDRIIGGIKGKLPKQWGAASKDADKEFGKVLNDVLSAVVGSN